MAYFRMIIRGFPLGGSPSEFRESAYSYSKERLNCISILFIDRIKLHFVSRLCVQYTGNEKYTEAQSL